MIHDHIRFHGTRNGGDSSGRHVRRLAAVANSRASEAPPTGVSARVLMRAGLDPNSYRVGPLARRTTACLRALRTRSETQAIACIEGNAALVPTALSTLLIGVSAFFRDDGVFQAIRRSVLPALADRAGTLRVASIGCSSGAELASIAILMAETGLISRARLLGVDCRLDAVTAARHGVFSEASLEEVPEEFRARYFERAAGGWRLVEALRRRMRWVVWDATRGLPPGEWNLLFCRNLFIYLRTGVVARMYDDIARALAPRGFLVVGKAERAPGHLPFIRIQPAVYQFNGF